MFRINSENYDIQPLKIGQIKQLVSLKINDLAIEKDEDLSTVIEKFLTKIPVSKFVAIILNPINKPLWEKDINELEKEIEFSLLPEELKNIIDRFFACCSPQAILESMLNQAKIAKQLAQVI